MENQIIPRIMIVATGSGAGKTTICCGILKALLDRKLKVSSFKCGPDYIDTMFHEKSIGTSSSNLDIFLNGEEQVKFLLAKNSKYTDISVIEGVMGMYDGLEFNNDFASSNHLSVLTDIPQILVVDVNGMSLSVVAMINGFLTFKQNNIKGVIFNNCSDNMFEHYKNMVESNLKIRVYGYLPHCDKIALESRNLGLVTAMEVENITNKLQLLAKMVEKTIDIDDLIKLANLTNPLKFTNIWKCVNPIYPLKIAVANDKAFCFIYKDNIDLLKKFGVEISYFSPIKDGELPENISGLILCGGYPELYAKQLSNNKSMLKSIKNAVNKGLPTIAECGGFMYLMDEIKDTFGDSYKMVSAISGSAYMTKKLLRFGYQKIVAKQNNLLLNSGEEIKVHEFHYSDSTNNGNDMVSEKRGTTWECIHANDTLFAGYPHINFATNIKLVEKFLLKCREFNEDRYEIE